MDESRTNSKIPFRKSDLSLIIFLIIALLLVNAVLNLLFGQSYKKYAKFNINNISTFVWNNGEMDISPNRKGGFVYPKENNVSLFYNSGLILGGKINNEIRVQGTDYESSFLPGKILANGIPEDPHDATNRVFKIRPDYKTADLKNEIEYDTLITNTIEDEIDTIFLPLQNEEEIRTNYEKDWNEWPAEKGAPFEDIDGNGIYNPQIDIPGIKGADQTLWFVMNDLNNDVAKSYAGSPSIGLEIQVTVWGYNNYNYLDDFIFKEYKIINKSLNGIKEMFASIWVNPDIGYYLDDFVGCDTSLNLGFAYNGEISDLLFGVTPPASGYIFIRNSAVTASKNMFSYTFGISGFNFIGLRYYYSLDELKYLEVYNLFLAKIATTGESFIDPNTGMPTKYCLSGDPISQTGWFDAQFHAPGERAFLMSSGPFDLAPNDTVKFVVAKLAALGRDRLSSVTFLKKNARFIQSLYPNFEELKKEIIPPKPQIKNVLSNFDNSININWDKETENFSEKGYEFQGYNIYQFFSKHNLLDNAVKVETFDKEDDVKEIYGLTKHPASGTAYYGVVQNGKNNGIKNSLKINQDFTKKSPFFEGLNYWFGVSAFYFNKENGKTVESEIEQIKVTPNFSEEKFSEINRYKISQNYPNPFNPTTKIKFTIPVVTTNFAVTTNTTAAIRIYDILGREVQTLYNGEITEGQHEIDFNATGLPSGIYFYQLQVNGRIIDSKKMVLIK